MNAVASYTSASKQLTTTDFLLNIIPNTVVGRVRARRDPAGAAVLGAVRPGARCRSATGVAPLVAIVDQLSHALFAIVGIVMRLAPIGAFGAMAFTVGRYGVGTLVSLGQADGRRLRDLPAVRLRRPGRRSRASTGFSLFRFLKYISEEILIVLGTSSSESALPRIMAKLERLGCPKPVVGLVVPDRLLVQSGRHVHLHDDGGDLRGAGERTCICRSDSSCRLLGVLLLTSKGAAAVTGGGFITLAATLAAFPTIPVAGLALLLGVDRFMSEARAITNLIGNAVATMVVARWEGRSTWRGVNRVLARGVPELHDPGCDTVAGEIAALTGKSIRVQPHRSSTPGRQPERLLLRPSFSRTGRDRHRADRRRARRQRHVRGGRHEEADEPGVVVERLQRRNDEPAPRQRAADQRRRNRAPVPAAVRRRPAR